jgi:hypothetical protein
MLPGPDKGMTARNERPGDDTKAEEAGNKGSEGRKGSGAGKESKEKNTLGG